LAVVQYAVFSSRGGAQGRLLYEIMSYKPI
jgi:hypothetical protein